MSAGFLTWLGGAMAIFLAASAAMRSYVDNQRLLLLGLALVLYTLGNLMMVRLMREGGMAVAISVSAVLQLVLAALVAFMFFGERPLPLQMAGIVLGVVAVTLILVAPNVGGAR
ncbi:EamA family transporter [Antarctobacter sp.]|uniref:EamA family transporter n=1 Tax=Antarctobacter sp. TaxID=1872577 RepID=UPI002B27A30A|nr:EamA family transporter [Antarctobacter sp.]